MIPQTPVQNESRVSFNTQCLQQDFCLSLNEQLVCDLPEVANRRKVYPCDLEGPVCGQIGAKGGNLIIHPASEVGPTSRRHRTLLLGVSCQAKHHS